MVNQGIKHVQKYIQQPLVSPGDDVLQYGIPNANISSSQANDMKRELILFIVKLPLLIDQSTSQRGMYIWVDVSVGINIGAT